MTEREARAQDKLMSLFGKLNHEQLEVAVRSLIWLVHQFRSGVGLPEPYYIVPDNSLLQDIRRASEQEQRFHRYVAIQSFAYFLRNYTTFDARLVITPTIFFESIGMRELKNEAEFRKILYQLKNELSSLDLRIMVLGIKTYKEAHRLCSMILRDARLLTRIFRDVKGSEWDISLREGMGIRVPFVKADELLPRGMKLRYFNEWYVRLVLGAVIGKSILESRLNKNILRKYLRDGSHLIASSLIKVRKDQLKGLGDVELFQYCNLRNQSASELPMTYIGLTFDNNLAKVLHAYSDLHVRSEAIIGGEDESSMMKKMLNYQNDLKRLTQFDEAQEVFGNNYGSFLDDLKPVVVSLEDKLLKDKLKD